MRLKKNCQLFKVGCIFALSLFVISCSSISHSEQVEAYAQQSPYDDAEYAAVLSSWARDVTLYKDLMMYFSGTATLMSPEMMEAYQKRFQQVQGETAKVDTNIVSEERDVLSVVVSLYTTVEKFGEFDDSKIWNSELYYNNQWLHPINIVRYRNKSSFQAYFSVGSTWSKMYVMQFRVPHKQSVQTLKKTAEQIEDTVPKQIVFSIHSPLVKANFYWR